MAAYYLGSDRVGPLERDARRACSPATRSWCMPGVYKDDRFDYGGFDRTIAALRHALRRHVLPDAERHARQADRDQGAPATARSIFDGDGAHNLFNLMAANYNYFEGITVRNTNVAFLLGIKNIAGSSGFTLKHSQGRERRPRRAGRLVGLEGLLHRRQRVHRPARPAQAA